MIGHGAIDVVVAGGGEVQRDRRFLEGYHSAGGDVEAAADAVAVAAAVASQAAEGQVQEDIRLVEGRPAGRADEDAAALSRCRRWLPCRPCRPGPRCRSASCY